MEPLTYRDFYYAVLGLERPEKGIDLGGTSQYTLGTSIARGTR